MNPVLIERTSSCNDTVDGQKPFRTTLKTRETMICWHLHGHDHFRVSYVVRNGFRPSTVRLAFRFRRMSRCPDPWLVTSGKCEVFCGRSWLIGFSGCFVA